MLSMEHYLLKEIFPEFTKKKKKKSITKQDLC